MHVLCMYIYPQVIILLTLHFVLFFFFNLIQLLINYYNFCFNIGLIGILDEPLHSHFRILHYFTIQRCSEPLPRWLTVASFFNVRVFCLVFIIFTPFDVRPLF